MSKVQNSVRTGLVGNQGWRYCLGMKTVTKQEALRGFDALGKLANAGETVVVTEGGEPWIKLVPAVRTKGGKSAAAFRARLNRISPKPIAGVDEVVMRVRG